MFINFHDPCNTEHVSAFREKPEVGEGKEDLAPYPEPQYVQESCFPHMLQSTSYHSNWEREYTLLGEMIQYFETFLKEHAEEIGDEAQEELRTTFHSIASQLNQTLSFNEVMSKLGIMYYQLEKDRKLTDYKNELFARLDMLEDTGQKALLLKEFAQIILPKSETVNPGGVYAVLSLLSDGVEGYFKNEHLENIQTALRHIQQNQEVASILRQPMGEIHMTMKSLIQADLKMNVKEPVTSWHAKLACLVCLFDDLRQERQDCYLTAPFIFIQLQFPHVIIQKGLAFISQGYFFLEDEYRFPLLNLVSANLFSQQALNVVTPADKIISSYPFQETLKTCGIKINKWPDQETTVERIIDEVLKKVNKTHLSEFLKIMYCSYTHNVMQQTLLATMGFVQMNYTQNQSYYENNILVVHPVKTQIITALQKVLVDIRTTFPDYQSVDEFFHALESKIRRQLWLVDKTTRPFARNLPLDVMQLLAAHRSFFLIEKNSSSATQLFTISDFKQALRAFVVEIQEESKDPSPVFLTFCSLVQAYFISDKIDIMLCDLMYSTNYDSFKSIQPRDYRVLNRLMFDRFGGNALDGPIQFFGISCHAQTFHLGNDTPYIIDLCRWLNKFKDTLYLDRDILLATNLDHEFILKPSCFQQLLSKDPQQVIDKIMIKPAMDLLHRPLSEEKMEKILAVTSLSVIRKKLFIFENPKMSAAAFREHFLHSLNPTDLIAFKDAFELVLLEVSMAEFFELSFTNVFCDLYGLERDDSIIQTIKEELLFAFEEQAAPLEIANKIKLAIVGYGLPKKEIHEIEFALYKELQLPCSFVLGDLNYSKQREENPDHELLTYKFSLWEEKMIFGYRSETQDVDLPLALVGGFAKLSIIYPQS